MRTRRPVRIAVAITAVSSLALAGLSTPSFATAPTTGTPSGPISYSYDPAGRLVGASQPGVGSVSNSYDPAGNLTAATPSTTGTPQLTSVTPAHARAGATVTLRGANFDPTAAADQVNFGAAAATVTAAAAGSLTVTVPTGATTGPVTVTVGGVTATGPTFTLDPAGQPPAVTGLSPANLVAGGSVTVSGSNFDLNPANDVVLVNQTRAQVTAATASSLTVLTPAAAIGSGKLTVSTPGGVATSSADLYLRPGSQAADVFDTGQRIVPPAAVTLATAGSGHVAQAVFDAPANGRLFVRIGTSTVPSCDGALTVYDPRGKAIDSTTCVGSNSYFDDVNLTMAGSYTISLVTTGAGGSVVVTPTLVPPDSTAPISTDGTPVTISPSIGQTANLTFSGTANQRIFVKITGNTAEASSCAALTVLDPSGGTVTSGSACSSSGYLDTTTLPVDGTYTFRFNPGGTDAGNATIAIYTVPPDSSIGVNADGSATTISTSIGQTANLTFAGTNGQRVFIKITGNTAEASSCVALTLLNPTGGSVASGSACGSSTYIDTTTLPADGTYTFRFNPGGTDAGSATIAIYTVAADSSTAVTADGSANTITTTIGQTANLTFAGTNGQRVFIKITGNTAEATSCVALALLNPTGGTVASGSACGGSAYIDTTTLPTTGTYTFRFNPGGTDAGSATIAIYTVPADSTAPITTDGTPVTISPSIGQTANLTFAGTASQKITISITGNTAEATSCVALTLLNPTGGTVTSSSACGSTSTLSNIVLPSAGTYTFRFNPGGTDAGNATIAISTVSTAAGTAPAASRQTAVTPVSGTALRTEPSRLEYRAAPEDARKPAPAENAAQPVPAGKIRPVPGWVKPAVSDRDGWQPSAANRAGLDWQAHRMPAPAASLPSLTAPDGVTALAGQVLTVNGSPLPGVTLSADGHATRSDRTGRFLLTGIAAGQRVLLIDGGTASTRGRRFGIFQVSVKTFAHKTAVLPYTVWMTKLDLAHATTIPSPTTGRTVLTTPEIPGFEVILPAGSVVRDLKGQVVRQISITPVPTDRPPFPLPDGVVTPAYFTVQPGGSYIFPQGAQIIYPNSTHAPAGSRVQFYNYDPAGRGWYVYGAGSVTADGKQVAPDPGVKVWTFTGAMINIAGLNLPAIAQALGAALAALAAADPVDPSTGLFQFSQTDLAENDTMPLTLTRSYRQADNNAYAFGQGFNWTYGMYQYSKQQYQQSELVFPNGSHIHFIRTSPGTGYSDAVFKATNGWGSFANAVMKWNGLGWDVTGHDGLTYVFGENQPLQGIRDRYGNQITITRAGGGQSGDITQVTSPHGMWISLTYNSRHQVTQAVDNVGRTVSYSYDSNNRLSSVTSPTGGVTSYTWNASNDLLTVTDARGNTIASNTYDANNRVTSQRVGTGGTYTFSYTTDANNAVTQTDVQDPDGHLVRYAFNADGMPTSKVVGPGSSGAQTTSFSYAATTDYLTEVTDPLGHKSDFTYDANGNVTTSTRLAGTAEARTTTFDTSGPYGQLAAVTDPLGHRTSYAYDSNGTLSSVTGPTGLKTSYTFTPDGQLATVADTASNTSTLAYNALGQLVSNTDPLHRVTGFFNDAVNRLVLSTAADGGQVTRSYDNGNHLTQLVDPDGQLVSYSYDPDGELTGITDQNGHTTSYRYDADGNPTGWTQSGTGAPTVSRSYDPAGNLSSVTDGRGSTTTVDYDALNRPTVVKYGVSGSSSSSSVSYSYDAGNRVTAMADTAAGTTTIGYDDFGQPTSVTTPQGTVGYGYDAAGRRTSLTVQGGTPVNYGYDATGRLTSVSQGSTSAGYGYDADGRLASLTLPGAKQSFGYDAASQLTAIDYTSGGSTLGNVSYGYDPAGRVVTEDGSWAQLALPAATTAGYNAANEATTVNGVARSYDGAGNLTGDGSASYTWNDRGQLASVTGPAGTESYGYGPTGLRTQVTGAGGSTSFLWDTTGNQVAELTGGQVTASQLTGPGLDSNLVRTDSTGSHSQLTDRLGSVLATVDPAGTVQSQSAYTPFGQQAGTGSAGTPGFTGRTASSVTGLQYNRDRYYDPTLGRFASQDPIGQDGGLNTYAYAAGDPVNATDPTGDAALLALAIALVPGLDLLDLGLLAGGLLEAGADAEFGMAAADMMGEALAGGEEAAAAAEETAAEAEAAAGTEPYAGQPIYRVYGGDSSAGGASWSPVNPGSVANYRDAAGLPSGGASGFTNTGQFVIEGTLENPGAVVAQRSALPLDGMKGGLPEYIIPQWMENGAVTVTRVSGANPAF